MMTVFCSCNVQSIMSLDAKYDIACRLQAVRHGVRNISNVAETAATLGFAPKHKQCQIHLQVTQNDVFLHAIYASHTIALAVSTTVLSPELVFGCI